MPTSSSLDGKGSNDCEGTENEVSIQTICNRLPYNIDVTESVFQNPRGVLKPLKSATAALLPEPGSLYDGAELRLKYYHTTDRQCRHTQRLHISVWLFQKERENKR